MDPVSSPAPCRNEDPELFFPAATDHKKFDKARSVCEGCSVRRQCLTDATERGEEDGVWGGVKFGQPMSEKHQIELDADGYPIGFDRSKLRKKKCGRDHDFTPENTRWSIHHGRISRACKACLAAGRAASKDRARAAA
ncbi:hypothetical protein GS982_31700 [Rhodococcus hoagii]|nr:hypothetical protein [Prescottella equi]NKZ84504.1 hypothetical protein [Prescottella equi]NKZ86527.1 hypothetical protein [Prescottella equi]NKZ86533.1 hypothetical protein [Prescottella equi]